MTMFDLCIIVRAAGERTADFCCAELQRQAPDAPFSRVEQAPFWKTLRAGLETGLDSGMPWMLSVDADVIPAPDLLARVQRWIQEAAPDTGVLTAMVMDKFLAGARSLGVRVYRREALSAMLELLPPPSANVRPESSTIKRLPEKGWAHSGVNELVGLHDYGQFYRDIYRTCFLHAHKHDFLMNPLVDFWRRQAKNDPDFVAALAGFTDGLLYCGQADCDAQFKGLRSDETLSRMGLIEKVSFAEGELDVSAEIEVMLKKHDSGEIAPVMTGEHWNWLKEAAPDERERRVRRLLDNLDSLSSADPRFATLLISKVRRMLSVRQILDTIGPREWLRYLAGRICRWPFSLFRGTLR